MKLFKTITKQKYFMLLKFRPKSLRLEYLGKYFFCALQFIWNIFKMYCDTQQKIWKSGKVFHLTERRIYINISRFFYTDKITLSGIISVFFPYCREYLWLHDSDILGRRLICFSYPSQMLHSRKYSNIAQKSTSISP